MTNERTARLVSLNTRSLRYRIVALRATPLRPNVRLLTMPSVYKFEITELFLVNMMTSPTLVHQYRNMHQEPNFKHRIEDCLVGLVQFMMSDGQRSLFLPNNRRFGVIKSRHSKSPTMFPVTSGKLLIWLAIDDDNASHWRIEKMAKNLIDFIKIRPSMMNAFLRT